MRFSIGCVCLVSSGEEIKEVLISKYEELKNSICQTEEMKDPISKVGKSTMLLLLFMNKIQHNLEAMRELFT